MSDAFEKLKTKYKQSHCKGFWDALGSHNGVLQSSNGHDPRFKGHFDSGTVKWDKRGTLVDAEGELIGHLVASAKAAYAAVEEEAKAAQKKGGAGGGDDDDDDAEFEERLSGKLLAVEMVLDSMLDLLCSACGEGSRFAAIKALSAEKIPVDPRKMMFEALFDMLRVAGDAKAAEKEIGKARAALADFSGCNALAEQERWKIYDSMSSFGSTKEDLRSYAYAAADALPLVSKSPALAPMLCDIFAACRNSVKWGAAQHERAGRLCAESIGWSGVKGGKLNVQMVQTLGMPFMAGFMNHYGYASKTGGAAFDAFVSEFKSRLEKLEGARKEQLECYAVAAAWSGLDKKKIEAFEAQFPGLADMRLTESIGQRFSGNQTEWIHLERALEKSGGSKWAKKHFKSFVEDGKVKIYGTSKPNAVEELVRCYRAVHAELVKQEIDPGKPQAQEPGKKGKAKAKGPGKSL